MWHIYWQQISSTLIAAPKIQTRKLFQFFFIVVDDEKSVNARNNDNNNNNQNDNECSLVFFALRSLWFDTYIFPFFLSRASSTQLCYCSENVSTIECICGCINAHRRRRRQQQQRKKTCIFFLVNEHKSGLLYNQIIAVDVCVVFFYSFMFICNKWIDWFSFVKVVTGKWICISRSRHSFFDFMLPTISIWNQNERFEEALAVCHRGGLYLINRIVHALSLQSHHLSARL